MDMTTSLEEARNLALQKIGRNLVNVQKLEAMLKHVLATIKLDGYPSTLVDKAARRSEKVAKMTLGQVIEELATTLFENSSIEQGRLELSAEPWVSARFTIEGGLDAAQQWKDEIETIRESRNCLVHHMLTDFDPQSIESCNALSAALDAQREQLMPVYKWVQSVVLARKEAFEELSRR